MDCADLGALWRKIAPHLDEIVRYHAQPRAFRGEKIIEVKPVWANKGEVLERLRAEWTDPDFVFAAGDDRTDEDLFERLQGDGWTIHVGPGPTRASYVTDFEGLREVLRLFAGSGNARKAS